LELFKTNVKVSAILSSEKRNVPATLRMCSCFLRRGIWLEPGHMPS
jgi:hypothetical protein